MKRVSHLLEFFMISLYVFVFLQILQLEGGPRGRRGGPRLRRTAAPAVATAAAAQETGFYLIFIRIFSVTVGI